MTALDLFATLGLAILAGADLFWVLFLLGLAASLSPVPAGPGLLAELALPSVYVVAALLHLAEAFARRRPVSGVCWDTLQYVSRPLAGALVGIAVVPAPWTSTAGAAIVGAASATLAHALRAGGAVRRWLFAPADRSSLTGAIATDLTVAGGVALVLWEPVPGGILCLTLLLGWALQGVRLLRLARFGVHLAAGIARRILGQRGWRTMAELSSWAMGSAEQFAAERGASPDRTTPGGLLSKEGGGDVSRVWIVAGSGGAFLLLGRRGGPASIPVVSAGEVEATPLYDRFSVRVGEPDRGLGGDDVEAGFQCLLVAKDGPEPASLLAALGAARGKASLPERNPP